MLDLQYVRYARKGKHASPQKFFRKGASPWYLPLKGQSREIQIEGSLYYG